MRRIGRERHEHSGLDGGPIVTEPTIDLDTLSKETLRRILDDVKQAEALEEAGR